jgi:Fur family ferric uptake transcriptional regulator
MATNTDSAINLLREQGMRMTPQRIAIVTEIMTTPGYLIPMQVIKQIQARVPGVSPSTVYRTLERLEQVGVLVHVHLESGIGYHRLADVQHVHLTCAGCGAERELPASALERLQRLIVDDHGFWPDFSHHAISGLCAACRERQAGATPAAHGHRDRDREAVG